MLKRSVLLAGSLVSALVLCRVVVAQAVQPVFEVAMVKPSAPDADPNSGTWSPPGTGSFTAHNVPLSRLLQLAYAIDESQIAGKPAWLDTRLYDITAKPEQGIALSREELRPRLQALLAARFHMQTHTEMRPTNGFALQRGTAEPRLTPTAGDHFPGFRVNVSPGHMRGFNWTVAVLATQLAAALHRPVADETGLGGSYDVAFDYPVQDTDLATDAASLAAALKQDTHLVLKAKKVPVFTLVIDAASPTPSEN